MTACGTFPERRCAASSKVSSGGYSATSSGLVVDQAPAEIFGVE